jgi:hypothetical protein
MILTNWVRQQAEDLETKLFLLQPFFFTIEIKKQGIACILTAATLFGDSSLET